MKFQNSATRNLRLVFFESAITSGLISMSIMTPFFYSIGLSNAEIALSQALFTIIVSLLNLPTGWIADRISRKWANIIGDFGCGIGHLLYAATQNFAGAVFCECWLGAFLSLSQGVDLTLLKHFSAKIDPEVEFFRRQSARLAFLQHLSALILVLLGGPLGVLSFRLAIALSSVPYFAGGIAACFIEDDSEKLQPTGSNPLRSLLSIVGSALLRPRLRWRLFAFAVGREMTHAIIWVLTPMLLLAGVPLTIVSLAWAINSVACILGARLALRYAPRLSPSRTFLFPLILMAISMSVLSYRINLLTVSFYLLMGVVCGWTGATLLPLVQEDAPAVEQTTIISLAKVMGQILYILSSLIIGWVADFHLRYAALATLLLFLPLGLVILHHLRRE